MMNECIGHGDVCLSAHTIIRIMKNEEEGDAHLLSFLPV